jgi:hypothetical protein
MALDRFRYAEALRAARDATSMAPDSARGYLLAARAWLGLGVPDSAHAVLNRIPDADPLSGAADSIRRLIAPRVR